MTRERTSIQRLHVEGFRSLVDVTLNDIPPIAVFFGKNGSGKSNILRAISVARRAVGYGLLRGALSPAPPVALDASQASEDLGLRLGDFSRAGSGRIRVEMTWSIGPSALRRLRAPKWMIEQGGAWAFGFSVVLLSSRVLPGGCELVVERARLFESSAALGGAVTWHKDWGSLHDVILPRAFENYAEESSRIGVTSPQSASEIATRQRLYSDAANDWGRFEQRLVGELMAGWAVSEGEAYRLPSGVGATRDADVEQKLHELFLSPDAETGLAIHALRRLLGRAGLFGRQDSVIDLRPVLVAGEKRVHVTHPVVGDLPLDSLGTGEQQVFLLLAKRVLEARPIVQIEEPEAHLHQSLMRPLADLLKRSVEDGPEDAVIDQLWIATHHHLFAIAPTYYDVRLESGATVVEQKNRAQAAEHFYEPGALWDALRSLVASGLTPDAIIFRTKEGTAVSVADIEQSEAGDRKLFNEWVAAATTQVVRSMKVKATKPEVKAS
jgi:ABC-type transport system involved in cytochrome c biogenesis ATPase subunit